jgi:hypothetical protein
VRERTCIEKEKVICRRLYSLLPRSSAQINLVWRGDEEGDEEEEENAQATDPDETRCDS